MQHSSTNSWTPGEACNSLLHHPRRASAAGGVCLQAPCSDSTASGAHDAVSCSEAIQQESLPSVLGSFTLRALRSRHRPRSSSGELKLEIARVKVGGFRAPHTRQTPGGCLLAFRMGLLQQEDMREVQALLAGNMRAQAQQQGAARCPAAQRCAGHDVPCRRRTGTATPEGCTRARSGFTAAPTAAGTAGRTARHWQHASCPGMQASWA